MAAVLWAIWGVEDRPWASANLPAWYFAPAEVAPESLRHEAARGLCYVAVLVNSEFESGPCRDTDSPAGTACFAAAKDVWCGDERVAVSTASWLLVVFALVGVSRLASAGLHRPTSAAERQDVWQEVIVNGLVGLTMLGSAYHTAQFRDLIIEDGTLRYDATFVDDVSKRGCSVRSGNCVIDFSSKTPTILFSGAVGLWILMEVIRTGYRRRREFFDRPATSPSEQK